MVFRGKLSRACKRCRDRRLKCDFRPTCGACFRANIVCTGYRDTQQLRVRNESEDVRRKHILSLVATKKPQHLNLSLEFRARESFFAHFVTGGGISSSGAWDFLVRFHDPTEAPEYLRLAIDAAALAWLSHRSSFSTTLLNARERYTSALRATYKALQSPDSASEKTVMASLLLDLFEKITNAERQEPEIWRSHVNGALALVRTLRLDQFKNTPSVRVLLRLSTNLLISYVSTDAAVPQEYGMLRTHIDKHLDPQDPKWRLSGLMEPYANLQNQISSGHPPIDCLLKSMRLDGELRVLYTGMSPGWHPQTTFLTCPSTMVYGFRYDSYVNRHVTQTWNVLRLTRIQLNEYILENCMDIFVTETARTNVQTLASEICASVPQYVDCLGARHSLHNINSSGSHICNSHDPVQYLACYTLIFPLFVAGNAKHSPIDLKLWVVEQLHFIGSHFGIRNAELVAQILEKKTEVRPWTIYHLLGSYAFGA